MGWTWARSRRGRREHQADQRRVGSVECGDEGGQNNNMLRRPTGKLDGAHHHPVAQPRLLARRSSQVNQLLKFASAREWRSSTPSTFDDATLFACRAHCIEHCKLQLHKQSSHVHERSESVRQHEQGGEGRARCKAARARAGRAGWWVRRASELMSSPAVPVVAGAWHGDRQRSPAARNAREEPRRGDDPEEAEGE